MQNSDLLPQKSVVGDEVAHLQGQRVSVV